MGMLTAARPWVGSMRTVAGFMRANATLVALVAIMVASVAHAAPTVSVRIGDGDWLLDLPDGLKTDVGVIGVDEDVERLAAGRRLVGVGPRRRGDVERGIARRDALGARAAQQHVAQDLVAQSEG
mgnify:CR=1 FL=1